MLEAVTKKDVEEKQLSTRFDPGEFVKETKEELAKEIAALSCLSSTYIVSVVGYCFEPPAIVMEVSAFEKEYYF